MTPFEAWAGPGAVGLSRRPRSVVRVGEIDVAWPELEPDSVRRVCASLREAGAGLAACSATELARLLGRAAEPFRTPGHPLRDEALSLLPGTTGLSPEMCALVLDGMAADWAEERLLHLLDVELEDRTVLDGPVWRRGRRAMAVGPRLTVQILAGSVPGVAVTALIRSLLVKSPTLLKPGAGDVVLPVLFGRSLQTIAPTVAEALVVTYWPGGSTDVEAAALSRAETVVAYGSDEVVRALRSATPVTSRFVPYHHRVSVGVVGAAALEDESLTATAEEVARAIAVFDRRGCVSPAVVYVDESAGGSAAALARALAEALAALETRLPEGPLDPAEASAREQARGTAELVAASGGAEILHGGRDADWTVVVDRTGELWSSCPGRSVTLRPFEDVAELTRMVGPSGPHLQSVGVAGFPDGGVRLGVRLGRLGATRIAPFAKMPFPPPWWHHDGRGPLVDLVRWVGFD